MNGNQSAMARHLGLEAQDWYQVVRLNNPRSPSKRIEDAIVTRCPGVTVEWIRRGATEGLSLRMARLLNRT